MPFMHKTSFPYRVLSQCYDSVFDHSYYYWCCSCNYYHCYTCQHHKHHLLCSRGKVLLHDRELEHAYDLRGIECHKLHVTRHTSSITHHTSHVTRHTSHVTRHTSHVTRHTSHVRNPPRAILQANPRTRAEAEPVIEKSRCLILMLEL